MDRHQHGAPGEPGAKLCQRPPQQPAWNWANNSLDSEYWHLRSADWEKTVVPFYSVGNWTGMGLHLRGNIEAFAYAASRHKKLRIHSGTHFHPFHSEEGRMDQVRFFDHWLKGLDTGILDEPPVTHDPRVATRELPVPSRTSGPSRGRGGPGCISNSTSGAESEWRARGDRCYDAAQDRQGSYAMSPPSHASVSSSAPSHALGSVDRTGIVHYRIAHRGHRVTGPIVLVLWVSSSSEDVDIFAVRNVGPNGKRCVGGWPRQRITCPSPGLAACFASQLDRSTLPHRPYRAR
jgi:hypothetical protein